MAEKGEEDPIMSIYTELNDIKFKIAANNQLKEEITKILRSRGKDPKDEALRADCQIHETKSNEEWVQDKIKSM